MLLPASSSQTLSLCTAPAVSFAENQIIFHADYKFRLILNQTHLGRRAPNSFTSTTKICEFQKRSAVTNNKSDVCGLRAINVNYVVYSTSFRYMYVYVQIIYLLQQPIGSDLRKFSTNRSPDFSQTIRRQRRLRAWANISCVEGCKTKRFSMFLYRRVINNSRHINNNNKWHIKSKEQHVHIKRRL